MTANNLLGLDIGERRIGVARVNLIARIPEPVATLINNSDFVANLQLLIDQYQIDGLVIGLPRNMNGQETAQSKYVRDFCDNNLGKLGLPLIFQDETLTSVVAEEALSNKPHGKKDIDAHAAAIILDDYIGSN